MGRVSRAVVFASATLAATAGCAHHQKASDEMGEPRRHGGGCVPPDQKQIDELEKRKAEAKSEAEKADIEDQLREARQPQCMPYGAPPARRRVV